MTEKPEKSNKWERSYQKRPSFSRAPLLCLLPEDRIRRAILRHIIGHRGQSHQQGLDAGLECAEAEGIGCRIWWMCCYLMKFRGEGEAVGVENLKKISVVVSMVSI